MIEWNKVELGATYGEGGVYWADYNYHSVSRDEQTIVMATYDNAFITRNGGETWILAELPDEISGGFVAVGRPAFAGNNGFVLLSAESWREDLVGTFKYDWNNETWVLLHSIPRSAGFYAGYGIRGNEDGQHCIITYWDSPSGHATYVSHDYGDTWALTDLPNTEEVWTIDVNKTGSNMVAGLYHYEWGVENQWWGIYISTDYGDTWVQKWQIYRTEAETLGYFMGAVASVCIDDSGEHIAAFFMFPTHLLTSSDYGETWDTKVLNSSFTWTGVHPNVFSDISLDGSRLIFASYYGYAPYGHHGVWVSSDFGLTWTEVYPGFLPGYETTVDKWTGAQFHGTSNTTISFINEWEFGDEDAGETIVYAPLCKSYDFGATWEYIAPYADWEIADMWLIMSTNSTGNIILGVEYDGLLDAPYLSNNSGGTWSKVESEGLIRSNREFSSSNMSRTGQHMLITEYRSARPYVSNNFGTSWFQAILPGIDHDSEYVYVLLNRAAISHNGNCMLVGTRVGTQYTYFKSIDYGSTWSAVTIPNLNFLEFTINEDGSLILGHTSNAVYYSSYGGDFVNITSYILEQTGVVSINPVSITCDEKGDYIYISTSTSPSTRIVYSRDGLLAWRSTIESGTLGRAYDTTCSYEGNKVFFAAYYGGSGDVFISINYGADWVTSQDLSGATFRNIRANYDGSILVANTSTTPYVGRFGLTSRIKSIAGVPFANISKVAGISVAQLNKIAGVEK